MTRAGFARLCGGCDAKDSVRVCARGVRARVERGGRRRHRRPTQPGRAAALWQGPYVGANLGYQWALGNNAANTVRRRRRRAGRLQLQIGQFVFGGETDLQMSDADDRFAGWKFSNPWFGTLRARAGFAMSNVLFYGTVGLAYGT